MEDDDYVGEDDSSEEESQNGWIFFLIIGMALGAIFFSKSKYEGQTAEEWFNYYSEAESRYHELKNCVEDYAYSNNYQDLSSIKYNCF